MYSDLKKIQDINLTNKTVIVRTEYDVPLEDGEVLDETRIKASVKTIEYLLKENCKVVLLSHLGRPKGEESDELSLMPVRFALGRLLDKPIKFAHIDACENSIKFMEQGEILLLENVRFHEEETSSDPKVREEFIKPLAGIADLYVNDAFGEYREHASVYELPKLMDSYAGFHLQKEIEDLNKLIEKAVKPYVAVLGGKKVDTKIPVLKDLVTKVDKVIIGGAMAYTFLKAKGVNVGDSLIEENLVKDAKEIIKIAEKNKVEILLPIDHVAGKEISEDAKPVKVDSQEIPAGLAGLDIGQKTIELYSKEIENAKTVLWNGPMGVFEWEKFSKGTEKIGECIALSTSKDCYKVAAGGDTTYAMKLLRIKPKKFNHVSIGGGMTLKFLSGEKFPVLDILK